MSGPAIAVHGLRAAYGETEVLHGLDFEVPWGCIAGYLGPNGSGKSTTIRAIVGLLRPTAGTVRLGGLDPAADDLEARRMLGYVPEGGGLYQLLTPREHLALVSDLHELEVSTAGARLDEVATTFELTDFLDRRIDTLSKGQRQRVAIATGLLHRPRILLLDEPLNGLDANAARVFRDELRRMASDGCAILYCSHILDVVERLCDTTLVLSDGRIVADAPTGELVSRSKDKTLEGVFHELTRADEAVVRALDEPAR